MVPRFSWHTPGMSEPSATRSVLATIVGYILVAVIVLVLFHFISGTILWLFRTLVFVAVLLGLLILYLRLKSPD
jgi:preprotein translocase subunit SecD